MKWTGYEADPAPESWLDEGALADVSFSCTGARFARAALGWFQSAALRRAMHATDPAPACWLGEGALADVLGTGPRFRVLLMHAGEEPVAEPTVWLYTAAAAYQATFPADVCARLCPPRPPSRARPSCRTGGPAAGPSGWPHPKQCCGRRALSGRECDVPPASSIPGQ